MTVTLCRHCFSSLFRLKNLHNVSASMSHKNLFVSKKMLTSDVKNTWLMSSLMLKGNLSDIQHLVIPAQQHLYIGRRIHTSNCLSVGYQIKENLKDCYSLLNVSEDCTLEELKEAYFKLAKLYHPDSNSTTADPKKFDQAKEAYKTIKAKLENDAVLGQYMLDDDDDDDFEFTRLQPQHRQYLSNEGIGMGTSSERKKQYDQHRVSKAQSSVFKYKFNKLMPEGDGTDLAVLRDQRKAKKAKMSNTMDRLVEDMIQESMSKGEFDNLSGAGKPLNFRKESPYMDKVTQKLNQILIDSGVQPEWIMLQKEIRSDLQKCREKLAVELVYLGSPPFTGKQYESWIYHLDKFKINVKDINGRIDKFNLIVPILNKQMMNYDWKKGSEKICKNPHEFLPKDFDIDSEITSPFKFYSNEDVDSKTTWKQVWTDFKEILRLTKDS